MAIRDEYKKRKEAYLDAIAKKLQSQLVEELEGIPRVDRVFARAKDTDQFIKKAKKKENGKLKYKKPLAEIQDQIGARIIVFYLNDVKSVEERIEEYYTPIKKKDIVPDSDSEFGYMGKHYVLILPNDLIDEGVNECEIPKFFELQIKTLFQHAWAEASHNLDYKPSRNLEGDQKRKIAYTAAQAWGADQMFLELFNDLDI